MQWKLTLVYSYLKRQCCEHRWQDSAAFGSLFPRSSLWIQQISSTPFSVSFSLTSVISWLLHCDCFSRDWFFGLDGWLGPSLSSYNSLTCCPTATFSPFCIRNCSFLSSSTLDFMFSRLLPITCSIFFNGSSVACISPTLYFCCINFQSTLLPSPVCISPWSHSLNALKENFHVFHSSINAVIWSVIHAFLFFVYRDKLFFHASK